MDFEELQSIWDSTATRDDRVHAFGTQVAAAAIEPILEALVVMYHEGGHGRFIDQGNVTSAGRAGIEAGFMALGRAGGNTAGSPYRRTWERARAVVEGGPFHGPLNKLPYDPI